jgi:hypothetical protein
MFRGATMSKMRARSEGAPTMAAPDVELFEAATETFPLASLKHPTESNTRTTGV